MKDGQEPEAYKIGWVPFLGLKIWLDSRPLIPRPETEWWTELFCEEVGSVTKKVWPDSDGRPEDFLRGAPHLRVLDLCAGSGAIGCAVLKHCPNATVYFGEIDPAHKATILKNIRENNLDESRAEVRIGDLFEPFDEMQFDFIAANPPYVPEGRALPASVENFEPARALRAGADGLAVIRRIAAELSKYLAPSGQAWVECDSPSAEAASGLFAAQGLKAEIRNDQYDRPRIIVISF
ncbi:MAG: methyltransferase [bacterium]|nr:methyltransferase [bacterium]